MIDRQSATWRAVATWAGKELATASEANEATGLPTAETEYLRGRIAAVRELMALMDEPDMRVVAPSGDYNFQEPNY